jgi:signal transduction histidine kinase
MRLRLILAFTLIALVSVVSVVVIARQNSAQQVRAYMFRGGMAGAEGLVTALEDYYRENRTWLGVDDLFVGPGGGQGRRQGNPNSGQGMMGMMNQHLQLADAFGNLIIDTNELSTIGQLSEAELVSAIQLVVEDETVGYLLPQGGMPFSQIDEANLLERLNQGVWIAALVAIGFSLVLAFWLSSRLLSPVRALTQAATLMAGGDLSQRVAAKGDEELASLGRAFNQMAASLEEAEDSRRAMTADIAHELRTPISVQRAHLEALQDGVYPSTPENLLPILEQNLQLTRLVDDLRTLALADAGQLELLLSPYDLNELVARLVEIYQPQAGVRGIDLEFSSPETCPPLMLESGRVEQILSNLFSNALRSTPDGGRIKFDIICGSGSASISVWDSGPGIPPDALPHLFERFYRADRGRSRAEGGSGLGLAIARRLAEAHGGALTAANHPRGGAIFTLTLPISI